MLGRLFGRSRGTSSAHERLGAANLAGGPGALLLAASLLGTTPAVLLEKVRTARLDGDRWVFTTSSGRILASCDVRGDHPARAHAADGASVLLILQDTLAALNHHDPVAARTLRDRLEASL